jgi:hypothetical protein
MGAGERVEHLGHQVARQLPAEAPLPRQYLPQRGARHVLEDGVERTVFGLPGVDQASDVRVGEFGAEPHLASEAGDLVLDVSGGVALPEAENLDGDRLPGGTLAALVDPTEAAFAQRGEDLVAAREEGADREDGVSHHRHRDGS